MAKAKSNAKPKTLLQASRQMTKDTEASRKRLAKKVPQGNIQKSARARKQAAVKGRGRA